MKKYLGSGKSCMSEGVVDKVLIYDPLTSGNEVWSRVAETVPGADLVRVHNSKGYQQQLSATAFDIVVLRAELSEVSRDMLHHELKLREREPGVLVVVPDSDPKIIATMYDAGVDRCIVQSPGWQDELGPAIRHLLRLRRLKEENIQIRAKLTEANHLLEEKNKRLDEFSMTVAHDIRGPLGGVCMKLEYLLDSMGSGLDERSLTLINRALDSSKRLTEVVQAMYEYAKLGSQAARMGAVTLSTLVPEVVGDLHFDESIDIKVGIGELPEVWGNAELLRRVFINLVNNAVKYNDKQEVVINIGTRGFIEKSLARYAEIFIADNGPGMPAAELAHLFSMFTRGSTVRSASETSPRGFTADGEDGLGVGLAVVKRIVELHYGEISVHSDPDSVGTTFVLTLPVEKFDFIT